MRPLFRDEHRFVRAAGQVRKLPRGSLKKKPVSKAKFPFYFFCSGIIAASLCLVGKAISPGILMPLSFYLARVVSLMQPNGDHFRSAGRDLRADQLRLFGVRRVGLATERRSEARSRSRGRAGTLGRFAGALTDNTARWAARAKAEIARWSIPRTGGSLTDPLVAAAERSLVILPDTMSRDGSPTRSAPAALPRRTCVSLPAGTSTAT